MTPALCINWTSNHWALRYHSDLWPLHSALLPSSPKSALLLFDLILCVTYYSELWVTYYWPLHSALLLNLALSITYHWPLHFALHTTDPCILHYLLLTPVLRITYNWPLHFVLYPPDPCTLQYFFINPASCWPLHSAICIPKPCIL